MNSAQVSCVSVKARIRTNFSEAKNARNPQKLIEKMMIISVENGFLNRLS